MARGRIYKSEVSEARASLIASGKHPSIDAVRVALGNTGSRTTIHRLLRELEQEEQAPAVRTQDELSDAIQSLITRLAGELRADADDHVRDAEASAASLVNAAQQRVTEAEGAAHQAQQNLEHVRAALAVAEAQARDISRAFAQREMELAEVRERVRGFERQLDEREERLTVAEQRRRDAEAALERLAAQAQAEALERTALHSLAEAEWHAELDRVREHLAQARLEGSMLTARMTEADNRQEQEACQRADLAASHTALSERYLRLETALAESTERARDLAAQLAEARRTQDRERAVWERTLADQAESLSQALAQNAEWRQLIASLARPDAKARSGGAGIRKRLRE